MPRLTAPSGATVEVPDAKVAGLVGRGFVVQTAKQASTSKPAAAESPAPKKRATKKARPKKSAETSSK